MGAVALAALVLAGCGEGDEQDAPETEGREAAEGATFSVAAGLADLPVPDGDGLVTVSVADVAAVAEANGLEPPASSADATQDWLSTMTGADVEAPAVLVPPAGALGLDVADHAAITGFSWVEADWYATAALPPDEFTVLHGPVAGAELGDTVTELEEGVWTVGDGEDYAPDLTGDRVVDQLGRPVRIARTDDAIATSLSTPMITGWLAGDGERLADDEGLVAVAEQLDAEGAVAAYLVVTPGASDAVGIGWSGDRTVAIVHDLATEDAAAEAVDALEQQYVDGDDPVSGRPYSTVLEVDDVRTAGRTVVVSARLAGSPMAPLQLLVRRGLPTVP